MTRPFAAATIATLLVTGCMTGEQRELGADLDLRVDGATLYRGALPPDEGGPAVEASYLTQTQFLRGLQGKSFSGVLGDGAVAAAVALDGDGGYWVVVAGPPLPETPGLPSFDASLSFSAALPAGDHTLRVAAVDDEGQFGAARTSAFTLLERPRPDGPLVFSLSWDTESDLDLHVVLPDGVEVYRGNTNSWERPSGTAPELGAENSGGRLDFDSNEECVIDGRRSENVYWTEPPLSGTYLVRVDTFSLCDAPAARWTAEAHFQGESVARSSGTSTAADTRFGHGAGAGVVAFELEVP